MSSLISYVEISKRIEAIQWTGNNLMDILEACKYQNLIAFRYGYEYETIKLIRSETQDDKNIYLKKGEYLVLHPDSGLQSYSETGFNKKFRVAE